jgi:hypothetical protein
MSDSSPADPVPEHLLTLRQNLESLPEAKGMAVCFDNHGSEPSNFTLYEGFDASTRDRFHRLAIQAGRLLARIPAVEQKHPSVAKESTPAGKWFRLLFERKPYRLYFEGESYPVWRGEPAGPRTSGRFFDLIALSVATINWLALLVEEQAGQPAARQAKEKKKRRGGGKRPLEKSNPVQFQVYERIQQEHRADEEYTATVNRLKGDKDFTEQVKVAALKLDTKLVRRAVAFFDQRKRDQARKKQETDAT